MATYYNEFNPRMASVLREMIKSKLIPSGWVDERSISDVIPSELSDFNQCHFFAGIGGWALALRQAGWSDEGPVWTGSAPCQPFSTNGAQKGFADERHLWPDFHWLIHQRRPSIVLGEQVSSAESHGWLGLVRSDLQGIQYNFGAASAGAGAFGAPHRRQRIYWVADTARDGADGGLLDGKRSREKERRGVFQLPQSDIRSVSRFWDSGALVQMVDGSWRFGQPGLPMLVDGFPRLADYLHGFGNAIVVPQAAEFVKWYMEYA